jgi:hypothetical protein
VHQHALVDAPGADDGNLGRNDDEIGEASADHAEIRQRDGRAAQLLRRDRARGGVGAQPVEARPQVSRVALAHVAHDRYDEAALRVDGNADVDALDEPPLARLGVVPGVERGFGLASRGNGAHQPDGDVFALAPIFDVRLLGHRGAHHLGVRRRHALCHGPAHAAQRLGRPHFGETLGRALHIRPRDRATGTGGLHQIEIDLELARERPHGWEHLQGARRRRRRRFANGLLILAEFADDSPGVLPLPVLGKFDERSPDLDQIALAAEQAGDAAALRGGDLDHGLIGLDRHQRLIDDHPITLVHVPGDDFSLFEPFPEIRQHELAHGSFRGF